MFSVVPRVSRTTFAHIECWNLFPRSGGRVDEWHARRALNVAAVASPSDFEPPLVLVVRHYEACSAPQLHAHVLVHEATINGHNTAFFALRQWAATGAEVVVPAASGLSLRVTAELELTAAANFIFDAVRRLAESQGHTLDKVADRIEFFQRSVCDRASWNPFAQMEERVLTEFKTKVQVPQCNVPISTTEHFAPDPPLDPAATADFDRIWDHVSRFVEAADTRRLSVQAGSKAPPASSFMMSTEELSNAGVTRPLWVGDQGSEDIRPLWNARASKEASVDVAALVDLIIEADLMPYPDEDLLASLAFGVETNDAPLEIRLYDNALPVLSVSGEAMMRTILDDEIAKGWILGPFKRPPVFPFVSVPMSLVIKDIRFSEIMRKVMNYSAGPFGGRDGSSNSYVLPDLKWASIDIFLKAILQIAAIKGGLWMVL
jgi:hypothetical protein